MINTALPAFLVPETKRQLLNNNIRILVFSVFYLLNYHGSQYHSTGTMTI
jgi:hypothetical protein